MTDSNVVALFSRNTIKSSGESVSQTHIAPFVKDESTSSSDGVTSAWQIQGLLIKRLNQIFNKAKVADWDGDGAEPISDSTYNNAIKLLYVLPTSLPPPEILPDSDGYIEFEWQSSGRNFSLYITDTNLVLYAGFYGRDDRLSGRFSYDGIFPNRAEILAKDVYKERAG